MFQRICISIAFLLGFSAYAMEVAPLVGPAGVIAEIPLADCDTFSSFGLRSAGNQVVLEWTVPSIPGDHFIYSNDRGLNWSFPAEADGNEARIFPDENGSWYTVFWQEVEGVDYWGFRHGADAPPSEGVFHTILERSTDDYTSSIVRDFCRSADGTLFALATRERSTEWDDVTLYMSADGGDTWTTSLVVEDPTLIKATLTFLDAGRIYVQWTDTAGINDFSDPPYTTWTRSSVLSDAERPFPYAGGWRSYRIGKASPSFPTASRFQSSDNGSSWVRKSFKDSTIGRGSEWYRSFAVDGQGNILCTLETDAFHGHYVFLDEVESREFIRIPPASATEVLPNSTLLGLESGWRLFTYQETVIDGQYSLQILSREIGLEGPPQESTLDIDVTDESMIHHGSPEGTPNWEQNKLAVANSVLVSVAPGSWLAFGDYQLDEWRLVYKPGFPFPAYSEFAGNSWIAPIMSRSENVVAGWETVTSWIPGAIYSSHDAHPTAPRPQVRAAAADLKGGVVVFYTVGKQWFARVSRDYGTTWSEGAAISGADSFGTYAGANAATDTNGHWALTFWDADANPAPSSILYSTDDAETWQSAQGDYFHPFITATPEGVFLLAFASQDLPEGDDTEVFVTRSLDFGGTWSPPMHLNTNALADFRNETNPVLAAGEDGHVLAAWTETAECSAPSEVYVAVSNDAGLTWAEPHLVSGVDGAAWGNESGAMAAYLGGSRFAVAWTSTDDSENTEDFSIYDPGSVATLSLDYGQTWSAPQLLVEVADNTLPSNSQPPNYYATGVWSDKFSELVASTSLHSRVLEFADAENEGEGTVEGGVEGTPEGAMEGTLEGALEGAGEGSVDGGADGEGPLEGVAEGGGEGNPEGISDGVSEGEGEGTIEGNGIAEGGPEGLAEGEGEPEGIADYHHSADTNRDDRLSLGELLRGIQLYNAGRFHCDISTEDHYNLGAGDEWCAFHDADFDPSDWQLNLSELLRLIQLYNTGAFYLCGNAEGQQDDGFCTK